MSRMKRRDDCAVVEPGSGLGRAQVGTVEEVWRHQVVEERQQSGERRCGDGSRQRRGAGG